MTSQQIPQPPGTGMWEQARELAAEAERQLRSGLWEFTPQDAALARKTADDLAGAIGPAAEQERMPVIERLEHLREALAVLALGIARTHGRLAWFLGRAGGVLSPVLRWRALPADRGQSFGTVVPSPAELTDAEAAVRRLRTALVRADTAERLPGAEPDLPQPGAALPPAPRAGSADDTAR
ncbi:hypothetical protein [Kitasatospora sp. NPDC018619]|uniref:hypothetical protein n=1 Tax=unclassified Kitasatospora TaxID=2633591 RepID=UPI0037A1849A